MAEVENMFGAALMVVAGGLALYLAALVVQLVLSAWLPVAIFAAIVYLSADVRGHFGAAWNYAAVVLPSAVGIRKRD